mgnify:CR=1 FL=1|jgi:hypothetical protein
MLIRHRIVLLVGLLCAATVAIGCAVECYDGYCVSAYDYGYY